LYINISVLLATFAQLR